MPEVLFVCKSNIHRSPAAEVIFNDIAEQLGFPHGAESAGTSTRIDGRQSSSHIVRALRTNGYPKASRIGSRRISESLLTDSDLILAMEQKHVDAIRNMFPNLPLKDLHTLSEYVGLQGGIIDPENTIRNTLLSSFTRWLPSFVFPLKARLTGIHPSDENGVKRVFDNTVFDLEKLIIPLIADKLIPKITL